MGFECEEVVDEETGELDWDGFFILIIILNILNKLRIILIRYLDAQEKGELDYSLCIMWD
jgi:hypothetical protein